MMGTGTNFTVNRTEGRSGYVTGAIQQASAKTGVDFDYLVKQAKVESSMNPNAKARTSSATGLYQFIEQTWLQMVKNHGAEHGYGKYADAIRQKSNGEFTVPNKAVRNQILNLRKDAQASSLMAAELATENNRHLKQATGIEPNQTDLYLAHFMGASGASNFIKSMQKNPWAPAASIFPEAARSNRGVFYSNGKPLSLQAIYNRFETKFDGKDSGPVVQTATTKLTPYPDNAPGPVFETKEAADWSRPNSIAQRITANRVQTGLSAFSSQQTAQEGFGRDNNGLGGLGFLRNPVQVMFMAQAETTETGYAHNRRDRYNA